MPKYCKADPVVNDKVLVRACRCNASRVACIPRHTQPNPRCLDAPTRVCAWICRHLCTAHGEYCNFERAFRLSQLSVQTCHKLNKNAIP